MKMHKVLGLMSGTSLDGLDLAYCNIWESNNKWHFSIADTHSVSYDAAMRSKLKNAITLPAEELFVLNNSYGTWLGEQAKAFINQKKMEVDFISSHGHTVHHRPEKGLTYQMGSGQHLANASGHTTICDFRTNDVALGGQGAPLVPIGDRIFFGDYDFCLNLGGISNISFEHNGKRVAYDIGLANMVLNYITQKIDLAYDKDGALAKTGSLNIDLLHRLNALDYYKLPFPKSTGYEWFMEKVVPLVEGTEDSIENLLHTCIHHICEQLAIQVKEHTYKKSTLWVTGGGALNGFLIQTLQEKLGADVQVIKPPPTLIEFKEALVFALMGVLRMERKTNVLCSVTGAKRDSSSGVKFLPH
ncbi:anhydro-N-acetylmuramic acid kinase [Saonia flava]|uniref:Anhydro-N-acetylmuramic acid kinase n=1 Tax=Saonia flava TaxID=523696 RepID=A0A846R4F7_9FLAO|nr:anhydro-N-acetylmuramic acid kinase [Saonia flava]NJB72254.1 anhydro-N-acetylmuramic acid kinase [Saonia flava]